MPFFIPICANSVIPGNALLCRCDFVVVLCARSALFCTAPCDREVCVIFLVAYCVSFMSF